MEFYIPYRTVATCFKQSKALHLISAQMLVLNCSSLQKIFLFARFRILEYICDQSKPPFFKKGVQSNIFSTHILCSFVSNTHIIKLCSLLFAISKYDTFHTVNSRIQKQAKRRENNQQETTIVTNQNFPF